MALLDDACEEKPAAAGARARLRARSASTLTPSQTQSLNPQSLIPGDFAQARLSRCGSKASCEAASVIPEPELPLVEVVERCAVSAAISDPRFRARRAPPSGATSISRLSVLGPIEPVDDISEVVVGTARADRRVRAAARPAAAAGGSRMEVGRGRVRRRRPASKPACRETPGRKARSCSSSKRRCFPSPPDAPFQTGDQRSEECCLKNKLLIS